LATQWLKGNLQAATTWGVGRDLPRAVRDFYQAQGYRFLGIADQNTYTWTDEYQAATMTGVPMVEASYPFGDLLALYMDHWRGAASLQGAVDWITREQGFAILAAPQSPAKPVSDAQALALRNLFAVEVFDARLAATAPAAADATGLWDRMLSHGTHVFAFAGDDLVSIRETAAGPRAFIEVLAAGQDLSALLNSMQQGAFYASTGAAFSDLRLDGKTIRIESAAPATIRFIGRGGRLLSAVDGTNAAYTVHGNEGYVRVELQSQAGRAWSQPYWISG
ncbi:MAG TPA: hypothetical protein VET65_00995, partial [Candidatus Limnocylindrales bacterium]|nr:hypothetical protein [Candidatus Limnocylindrales bacterium]